MLILIVMYCETALRVKCVCVVNPPTREGSNPSSKYSSTSLELAIVDGTASSKTPWDNNQMNRFMSVQQSQTRSSNSTIPGDRSWKEPWLLCEKCRSPSAWNLESFWGVLFIRDMGCAIAPSHFFKD